jgi:BirA family biotin operon repressor/biotin-[acetyl-CoA-carboxylase] ligase
MERPPVDVARLRSALDGAWARVDVVDETESTNAVLLADTTAPDRSVLVAEHQVHGRGRLDRTWTSPARAGLTFSVALRPATPVATWGWLSLLTGVALHEALTERTGLDLTLKWPNDLLDGPSQGKVAGILAQTNGEAVVVGIGLNVSTARDELPVETATSLALCGATALDRTELLTAILRRLDERISQWTSAGGDAEACGLRAAYVAACGTLGRAVAVTTTAGTAITGQAIGIDRDGRLQVEQDGVVATVGAGDVEHLHPAE